MKSLNTATNKFKARLLAASGISILVLAISMTNLGRSIAQTARECMPVSICNTASEPVPVRQQGVSRVEGSVAVTSPVTVQASPREPLSVTNVVLKLNTFQRHATIVLNPGESSTVEFPSEFAVPAGKILKLEHVSAAVSVPHPQSPQVILGMTLNGQNTSLWLSASQQQQFGVWTINQNTTAYAEPAHPGGDIEVTFRRFGPPYGQATMTITLTGLLLDQ